MVDRTRQEAREDVAPLSELGTNKYKFSSLNYPSDIENLSHALLFNVLIQDSSKDLSSGKIQQAKSGENGEPVKSRTADLIKDNVLGLTRRTKRSTVAISLYVPETIVFDNSQNYQTPNLLDSPLGIAGAAAATGISRLSAGAGIQSGAGAIAATLGSAAGLATLGVAKDYAGKVLEKGRGGIAGDVVSKLLNTSNLKTAAQYAGFAINPVIEVLYSSPNLRSFNFDFVFAPRSLEEADAVWSIIYQFRRHSAPELLAKGTMFVPPSEFDITFLRKTTTGFVENTNVPRISSCVLKDVQIDYASIS